MKLKDQIKSLAELDDFASKQRSYEYKGERFPFVTVSDYLTSYDAIIPLIQKRVWSSTIHSFQDALGIICAEQYAKDNGEYYEYQGDGSYFEYWLVFNATPAQLCEALLRSTGKWIE